METEVAHGMKVHLPQVRRTAQNRGWASVSGARRPIHSVATASLLVLHPVMSHPSPS